MINRVMAISEDAPEQLELPNQASTELDTIEARREKILHAINSSELNTMEERVAWLLNNFPKTRDSDITLQIRYWQNFESDRYDGGDISLSDYYRLAKLTSLTRARATIQNKLGLFQASEEVLRHRKKLEVNEKANALRKRPNCHQYAVYVDESGKTQNNLIVGSLWYLNGAETTKIYRLIADWRKAHSIDGELHFKAINEAKLPHYLELAELLVSNSAMLSFKAVSVPRAGISNVQDALMRLTCHLLTRGIEHEHSTGRAVLPRGISVCKDAEEVGHDKIFAAELSDKLKQAAASQFQDQLYVEEFYAEESKSNVHLQITDLFTSSLGRALNAEGERRHPKDKFADFLLGKLNHTRPTRSESVGDMTVHISL
jgi:hypothetical protein